MKKTILHIAFIILSISSVYAIDIDSYLSKEFKEYNHFTYEVNSIPTYVESIDSPKLLIDNDRRLRVKKEFVYLPVKIKVDSDRFIKSIVTLKVKLYQNVVIASRDIKSGESLNRSDFIVVEKNVTRFNSELITDFEQLNQATASRNINKEAVVTYNMVKSKPLIERGDRLNASLLNGTVQITFPATAREEGFLGKKIKVVRDDRRIFFGKVIDSENVIIE